MTLRLTINKNSFGDLFGRSAACHSIADSYRQITTARKKKRPQRKRGVTRACDLDPPETKKPQKSPPHCDLGQSTKNSEAGGEVAVPVREFGRSYRLPCRGRCCRLPNRGPGLPGNYRLRCFTQQASKPVTFVWIAGHIFPPPRSVLGLTAFFPWTCASGGDDRCFCRRSDARESLACRSSTMQW